MDFRLFLWLRSLLLFKYRISGIAFGCVKLWTEMNRLFRRYGKDVRHKPREPDPRRQLPTGQKVLRTGLVTTS